MVIQLLGTHPSVADAPVIPGASRWVVNVGYQLVPAHVVFDLHPTWRIQANRPQAWRDYPRLIAEGIGVMLLTSGDLPGSDAYPRQDVQDAFGQDGEPERCFQSSLDWMLALALVHGARWIDVQGVRMQGRVEYVAQRASFLYWMGRARGMGVRVTVPEASGLGVPHALYGYEYLTGSPGDLVGTRVYGAP